MKLFELIFDEDDDIGVFGVSLVDDPAVDFEAIQLSADTPLLLTQELVNSLQKNGKSPLKYNSDYTLLDVSKLESTDNKSIAFASEDNSHFEIRYRYNGGLNNNSRDFCRTLVSWNREWSRDDIDLLNDLNPGFGKNGSNTYDVFKFKGGVNCKHFWERLIYWKSKDSQLTYEEALQQIPKNIVKQIPKIDKRVGQIASASNNYWRMSSEKERTLTQPILIPNQKIYRKNIQGEEAHVFVSADTIKKLAKNFFKQGYHTNSTIEHDENQAVEDGFHIWESWIVNDSNNDKSNQLGFDVPPGTWMVTAQLSKKLWDEFVESGEVKGLSIDAMLKVQEVDNQEIKLKNENKKMNKKNVLTKLRQKMAIKFNSDRIVIDAELGYTAPAVEVGQIVTDADDNPVADFRFEFDGVSYITNSEGVIDLYTEEVEFEDEIVEEMAEIVEEIVAEIVEEVEAANNDAELIASLQAKIAELEAQLNATTDEVVELKRQPIAKKVGFSKKAPKNETFLEKTRRLRNL